MAATLTVTDTATSYDVIRLNGGAGITLHLDASTTGSIGFPPTVIDSIGRTVALTGTWAVRDSLIDFTPREPDILSSTTFRLLAGGGFAGAFDDGMRRVAMRFVRQGGCNTRECP